MNDRYYDSYTLALERCIHLPYTLVGSKELKDLSVEAKILYACLFDWQCNYSSECDLVDEQGCAFVRLQNGIVPHFEWNDKENTLLIEELKQYSLAKTKEDRIYILPYKPKKEQLVV